MKKLSIITPCYNEEENIKLFYNDVKKSFNKKEYDIEIIFINDGSKDKTINELKKLVKEKDFIIKVINFSRNFGKESAIYAGLENSTGDYVVLIDADMQQPPSLILPMLKEIEKNEDVDIVAYYQDNRIENKFISGIKMLYYKVVKKITKLDFYVNSSDFRLMKRQVVESILSLTESSRFTKGIFAWIGFNTVFLPYTPLERQNGTSSFNVFKLFKYGMNGILDFSKEIIGYPLKFGVLNLIISIIWFIVLLILEISFDSIQYMYIFILFLNSMVLLSLGLNGNYILRTYDESRKRPIYIVKEMLSNEEDN